MMCFFLKKTSLPAGDVPGEVDGVDSLQDDVVGLHGVSAGERRGACASTACGDLVLLYPFRLKVAKLTCEELKHEHSE